MKNSWLSKNDSEKLILFFNGWGMDCNIVKHLNPSCYDVLMFNEYYSTDIDTGTIETINNYKEVNVISWSFGVWASSFIIDKINNLKSVIAINGTLKPIDDYEGIAEKILNLTLKNFSEENYKKFFSNMFYDKNKINFEKSSTRDFKELLEELKLIKKMYSYNQYSDKTAFFNKVFISNKDKIFSPKNQINFWSKNEDTKKIMLDDGHYIFDLFNNWEEIIVYENN